MRVCLFVCVWDMSGCFVCDFLWGERSSRTFSGLLISLQRVKLLLRSHSVITLQSRKCLRLHPCYPAPGTDLKIALNAISYKLITRALCLYILSLYRAFMNVKLSPNFAAEADADNKENLHQFT